MLEGALERSLNTQSVIQNYPAHNFTCGEQGQQVADTIPEVFWNLENYKEAIVFLQFIYWYSSFFIMELNSNVTI